MITKHSNARSRYAAAMLVGLAAAAVVMGQDAVVSSGGANDRRLQGTTILPVAGTITATVGGMSLPFSLPLLLGGGLGTPGVESPQRFFRVSCDKPRPTFVVIPGEQRRSPAELGVGRSRDRPGGFNWDGAWSDVNATHWGPACAAETGLSGSQLDATQTGGVGGCPSFSSPRQVYADLTWLKNLQCFAHMMSAGYDGSRYFNTTGTQMWAWGGGYPDGTLSQLSSTYYQALWRHLETAYGYKRGVDMFATPWDWRWDYDGLDQIGQLDQMADRIAAAVNQNCGQKAILMGHSMGANVALRLLREPRFKAWRQQHVKALVMVGGTLSGAVGATWQTKLSGVLDPFPSLTNSLPGWKVAAFPLNPFEAAIYQMSLGSPSMLAVAPGVQPLGPDHVVVRTPRRSYTIGQQKELLRDMGDDQSLLLFDKVQAQSQALVDAGPVPGIDTFCLYGSAQPTPLTLVYGQDIPRRQVMRRPASIIRGPGDGTVDLKTLRLCNKLAPTANIVEVNNPSIDHASVLRDPAGLAGFDSIMAKIGVGKGGAPLVAQQVSAPVANRPAGPGGPVTEEKGRQG